MSQPNQDNQNSASQGQYQQGQNPQSQPNNFVQPQQMQTGQQGYYMPPQGQMGYQGQAQPGMMGQGQQQLMQPQGQMGMMGPQGGMMGPQGMGMMGPQGGMMGPQGMGMMGPQGGMMGPQQGMGMMGPQQGMGMMGPQGGMMGPQQGMGMIPGGMGTMGQMGGYGFQNQWPNQFPPQFPSNTGQVTQLQQQINDKEQEIQKYKSDLDKLKKNTVSKDDFEILENQWKKLKSDSANTLDLQENLERLNRKIKTQKEQSDEDEETIKKLKTKILDLERQLEELKKSSKATIDKLQDDNDSQKLKIQQLLQNDSSTSNSSIFEEECDKLKKQVRILNTQVKELQEQNQQLQASDKGQQMIELQFEITKLKSDLEVEHNNYTQKLDVIADLKKKLDVKDRDCKIKDESLGSLEHLAKEKTNKIKQLEQDIKNLQEQVLIEQNNIKELNQSMTKLRTQLLNQKGSVDQKQNQALIDEMNQIQNKQEQQRLKKLQDEKDQQRLLAEQALQKQRLMNEQKQKQEEDRKQRMTRAENIKRKMQESHGQLEVCFIVDCTGSMEPYKEQTMQSISGSMKNIKIQTGRDVKWSTVCYQDYGELAKLPGKLYHQQNFTKDPGQLEEYLKNVKCSGGGDFAEDIRGGIIQMCQKISWDKPFRLAILICDAPSHGSKYNDGCGDNYPNDDIKDAILMLIKQDIMFIGLNFTKYTKKMYSYIENIFVENKRPDLYMYVNMDGVKQADIWKEMVSKISDASVAVTATNKRETKSKGEAKTDAPKTKDGAIEALCKAGNFYDFDKQANVKSIDTRFKVFRVDIKDDSFKLKLEDIHRIKVPEDYEVNEEGFWDCIRTEKPFAFGMMKEVYLMKKKNATQELYVIKTPLGGKTYSSLNDAITECRSHLVCQRLMKKFIKEVNEAVDEAEAKGQQAKRYPQIVYSDFLILEESPKSFWIAERFFKGEFIKYNNNNGFISEEKDQLNQMAQAFSYYTYHISNFNYMVNDVQGVSIYFTDPAINTCKGDFDDTDMGEDGQSMFMVNFEVKKQVCSDILKLLNIYPD